MTNTVPLYFLTLQMPKTQIHRFAEEQPFRRNKKI
jgi:hypothetical protein